MTGKKRRGGGEQNPSSTEEEEEGKKNVAEETVKTGYTSLSLLPLKAFFHLRAVGWCCRFVGRVDGCGGGGGGVLGTWMEGF